ncbi:MAG: dephospho-CoA kinase [Dysgonamonadaceae bacterium]|jgi:dephospho-CoA kinase|nr:dephospho-CoA kinase [Dysgonamonadaceae bacterium]
MTKVGITGGIGSGKSVVCELFRVHDIPVFDADAEAKKLNDTSPVIREKLTQLFGNDLYENNRLNRQKLASFIFSNSENLQKVNAIIHPEVAACFEKWTNEQKNAPIVVIETAILFESGFDKLVDKTVTVYSPKSDRVERVVKRDNTDIVQIEARMKNQMPEEEKIRLSDFVIINDNHKSLIEQIGKFILDRRF